MHARANARIRRLNEYVRRYECKSKDFVFFFFFSSNENEQWTRFNERLDVVLEIVVGVLDADGPLNTRKLVSGTATIVHLAALESHSFPLLTHSLSLFLSLARSLTRSLSFSLFRSFFRTFFIIKRSILRFSSIFEGKLASKECGIPWWWWEKIATTVKWSVTVQYPRAILNLATSDAV